MFVGRAELTVTGNLVSLEKYSMMAVDDALASDTAIQRVIDEQKFIADSIILRPLGLSYDMQVAESTFELISDEYGNAAESNLGVLVADAIYYYMNTSGPGADVSIVAAGVLRDPIEPGIQSIADIFRVMSLGSGDDNVPGYPLSRMWVTGKELKNITEILLFTSASTPSNFPYFSHLRIEYDPDGRIFNKVRKIELTDQQGNISEVNTSKDDPKLYSIAANSYMADNLGLVKKKTLGLIKVEPKDAGGSLITDLDSAVADFNPAVEGIQEGKEWLALVKYFQQFAPAAEGGLPIIPAYYSNPDRSLVAVPGEK
jgi:2',3'-cyclic-nucleotide 2'-phosphodiesterase (5'-nucleotidase family)